GYYYGFSNEGLWPLCHIAHTRPVFRNEDWTHYKRVNEKYAQAVAEELAGTKDPFVLIQDYHFALLPKLIRHIRPDAKIAIFWHIPWPNPESFGICPWSKELLLGLLGADLIGFHIQFHCNNFLDTADRLLESRIDWEQFAVNRAGHKTVVKPFPIGIATGNPNSTNGTAQAAARQEVLRRLGHPVKWLGVGVDRIDYTKGISERFRAIEHFLEKHPEFKEQFTFVELAAPSRTIIKRYNDLGDELEKEAREINQRLQTRTWKPIIFRKEHHNREEIDLFYHAADLCLVTSLHDGMNLVGKEFVWSRSDERGVLVLSRFAGASRQLKDALLVNPYDIEEVAEAIYKAATMPPEEQRARMARMRSILDEHNVYRWAADITTELDRIRSDTPKG
ncbi:MAG: trehalose-6-phosphate synthase, partial [Elusimicrobia bacterium]|nr:trehalose-6-phosphate synthase [Elusimicrobiota bacterium]